MKRTFLYISLCILCACSGTDDDIVPDGHGQEEPISFSVATQSEGEVFTRATTEPLSQDFVVFGFKNVGGVTQTVFDGYNVKYEGKDMTGITPYSYVGGTSTKGVTQEPKYWDYSATDYRFWAFVKNKDIPVNVIDASHLSVGTETTEISDIERFYIAELKTVTNTDYRNVVTLPFGHLCAKIELRFFTSIPLGAESVITLTDIGIQPSSGDKFATKGKIDIEYPLAGDPKETITWPEGTYDYMAFDDVEIHNTNNASNKAVRATPSEVTGTDLTVYTFYPLNRSTSLLLYLKQNGKDKTALVPDVYTNWKPNCKYIYLFKIGESLDPVLYDVKVEPWTKGGEQSLEFKNW